MPIDKAITPRTKAIILNSPSKPGRLDSVDAEDLERIVHPGANDRGIYLLLDECYVYLNYAGKCRASGGSFYLAKEHIVISGLAVEDLRHDRLAGRLCPGLQARGCQSQQALLVAKSTSNATSFRPEGRHRRPGRLAGLRSRIPRRIHRFARLPCYPRSAPSPT